MNIIFSSPSIPKSFNKILDCIHVIYCEYEYEHMIFKLFLDGYAYLRYHVNMEESGTMHRHMTS